MTEEEIQQLALKAYPKRNIDEKYYDRTIYIAALRKASELMLTKQQAIDFHNWMEKNDTEENACLYFHYTDNDMLQTFLKSGK